jgi:cell division septal protein FtsQ
VSPIAAPADRRFRRVRVKPGRKRGRLSQLVGPLLKLAAIGALMVYAAYRGGSVVAHAGVLQIDDIVVSGNGRLSTSDVLDVLGGLRGENIVFADLGAWRRRLLASPWVRDAAFRRALPSRVEVVVSEREPIAIGRIFGELYLVDDRGAVIDQYGPQYGDLDLPIVDGLASQQAGGTMVDPVRADLAVRLITSLQSDPGVAGVVSQVDVSDVHNAKVILNGDAALIYLGRDRFLTRMQTYLQLASALRQRVPEIDYVDLRFDGRIYVRPARGGR